MKSYEEIMEILEAYDLTKSFQAAAELAGCSHHTLEDRDTDALVFTAPRGGPVRLNNFRRRVFGPAAGRIGTPGLVPHDLRDTAAWLAISSGASIKAVQRMLGHASAKMTLDVYGSAFRRGLGSAG